MTQIRLKFLLLPIRDWNQSANSTAEQALLKFLLLPIRDWNAVSISPPPTDAGWNFSYSLLGIETPLPSSPVSDAIARWNFSYSLLGIETYVYKDDAGSNWSWNFSYSLLGIETMTSLKIADDNFVEISLTPY